MTLDKSLIGEAQLQEILYMFYENKFAGIQINFHTADSVRKLTPLFGNLYGTPSDGVDDILVRRYVWTGKVVQIEFIYNKPLDKGVIYYYYLPIMNKQEKERAAYEKRIEQRELEVKEKKAKSIADHDL